ncbi:rhodanese-like domain-containing protein [Microlunatus panaciterrae]|uniref:Rhodanese-related sulfurtransferase n=1 Tax=Microlunatus panaciterrae TaxID=400768 RepID=A0ABS2RKP3_9ACTN|nr:rhodanese-like domain-containing protein [Microlunatus panaciterrae]MBM7799057.1 rhodanese-related sulfurtransferase [Microlunatus panaciterrae]
MFGNTAVPRVTAHDLAAKKAGGWMLLDVRTEAEWAQGRIEGSTHIPLDQLVARLGEIDDQVVCICAVGGRSARATAFLLAQGKEAVNLDGGVQAWAAEGLPLSS